MNETQVASARLTASIRYAPIVPDGPLPPGFSADAAARAFRVFARHLKPKHVVQGLGVRPLPPDKIRAQMRALLDDPRYRIGNERVPPLFLALFHAAGESEPGKQVRERIIKPAEVERDDLTFLSVDVFARAVAENGGLFTGDPESDSPAACATALAEYTLAFGLLQPADAPALVAASLAAGAVVQSYFGFPEGLTVNTLAHLSTPETPDLTEQVQRLRLCVQSAAALAQGVAKELEAGVLQPAGLAPLTDALADLAGHRERLAAQLEVEVSSLADVDARLAAREVAAASDGARAVLAELRLIEHREGAGHALTQQVREAASQLEAQLSITPDLATALASGSHGASALLSLVKSLDLLSDEALESLKAEVTETFGPDVGRAASRGLLILGQRPATDGLPTPGDSGSPRATEPVAAEPATTGEVGDEIEGAGDPASASDDEPEPAVDDPPSIGENDATASLSGEASASATKAEPAVEPVEPMVATHVLDGHVEAAPSAEVPLREDEQDPHDPETDQTPKPQASVPPETVWRLIERDRLGLAWHLSVAAEHAQANVKLAPPADVVEALLLGPHVRSSAGPVMEELRPALERIQVALPAWKSREDAAAIGSRALLLAALLRPSLLASHSAAPGLLAEISVGNAATRELQSTILHFSRTHAEVTPSLLRGIRGLAAWDQEVKRHILQCRQWLEQNRQASIIYAPTTEVWRRWLRSDVSLGRALEHVSSGADAGDQVVREAIAEWGTSAQVSDALTRTSRELRRRAPRIEARARTAILARVDSAVRLLQEWLDLLDAKPSDIPPETQHGADVLRTTLQPLLPRVRAELLSVAGQLDHPRVQAAVSAAVTRVMASVEQLFDSRFEDGPALPNGTLLRSQDLLSVSRLRLDAALRPRDGYAEHELVALLACADSEPLSLEAAFDVQCETGNHVATAIVLDAIEAERGGDAVAPLRARRDRELSRMLGHQKAQALAVQTELGRAAFYELFSQSEHLQLKDQLDSLVSALDAGSDAILDCTRTADLLSQIQRSIAERRRQRSEEIRRSMTDLANLTPATRARIESALDAGDFLAATEYIDMCRAGQAIPESRSTSALDDYFPEFVRQARPVLSGGPGGIRPRDLINSVRNQRSVPPLHMHQVRGAQADSAADMLEAWYGAKNQMGVGRLAAQLGALFKAIGFTEVSVHGPASPDDDRRWIGELRSAPVADRDSCVIPLFGSVARGRYRLIGLWDRPTEEEILSVAGSDAGHLAVIVLYFGVMSEQGRRKLAELCRARRRTFLLIDESVVLFLCGARGLRLPLMFQALLPFTVADPYITTAGLLPPEMFFGRAVERESIMDSHGTNLIYGGRQLGKTALLRDAERQFHRPDQGRVVVWLDLRAEQIGISRPIPDVWPVIARHLTGHGFATASARTRDDVTKAIGDWLAEDEQRRLVLLLDEADAFLDSDGKGHFDHVGAMKNLMDVTGRRFKVVFAGLHNVQRASRAVNTPLAHLGQPICIGPLLDAKDAIEALALITKPLGDLGYRFESDDLPMRILSHTNYYPSLIQIYCKHLLAHLVDPSTPKFDARSSPPYVITGRHLDAVQDDELRAKILEKFRLTLDLDPRYRLIALCIALAHTESHDPGFKTEGVEPSWVREQALYWWSRGFAYDNSLEAFRNVLEEMIGLGILRRVSARRYTLRSSNLANLLGTAEEIADQLLDASQREAPVPYEQGDFRRRISEDPCLRSPLTAQQEAKLLETASGVCIVAGTRVSGVQYVRASLEAASQGAVEVMSQVSDAPGFIRALTARFKPRHAGLMTVVVPSDVPWAERWVEKAVQWVEKRLDRHGAVRIIFVADGPLAWGWSTGARRQELLDKGVQEVSLRPWADAAIRLWAEDLGLALDDARRRSVQQVTGNWTELLSEFARRCVDDSHLWKEHLDKIEQSMGDTQRRLDFQAPTQVRRVFTSLADYEAPISTDEIAVLAGTSSDDVERAMTWAELVAYASSDEEGRWLLAPSVSRLFTT